MELKKDILAVGYLTYVTEENKNRRYKNFKKSLNSLSLLKDEPSHIVLFDNDSCTEAKKDLDRSLIFDKKFFLDSNFMDISVLYGISKYAKENNFKYCLYMYDDFIITNSSFIDDCLSFMEMYSEAHCLRIPSWSWDNIDFFNSAITPKSKNPDSVRHYNTVTGDLLEFLDAGTVGKSRFFINNWHYTSRPTIWRTDVLFSIFENIDEIPVMQNFEALACNKFQKLPIVCGVLDGGAMQTVKQSERMEKEKRNRWRKYTNYSFKIFY